MSHIHICNNSIFIFSRGKIQSYRRNFEFRPVKYMPLNVNVNYDIKK